MGIILLWETAQLIDIELKQTNNRVNYTTSPLDKNFGASSDPTRRVILPRLAGDLGDQLK